MGCGYNNYGKGEVWNFKEVNGYCHGYVKLVTRVQNYDDASIDPQKIDPS